MALAASESVRREQTVKNHMHRILRQVNAEDRYEAVETVRSFRALVVRLLFLQIAGLGLRPWLVSPA
jgi:hypothetical protein